jgi:hypothetical protein
VQPERYVANPDVVSSPGLDGTILLNPDTNAFVQINAVGHLIWQTLAWPVTEAEIVDRVSRNCQDVPADQVAADVTAFLRALQPGGFVGEALADGVSDR